MLRVLWGAFQLARNQLQEFTEWKGCATVITFVPQKTEFWLVFTNRIESFVPIAWQAHFLLNSASTGHDIDRGFVAGIRQEKGFVLFHMNGIALGQGYVSTVGVY